MTITFPEVSTETLNIAVQRTLSVLQDEATPRRLAKYYNRKGDYVGRSFVDLEPNDHEQITPVDLMATSMLNIKFPASAVRRLLEPENQRTVSSKLKALPTGENVRT